MNKRCWEDLGTGLNWKLLSSNDIHTVSPSRYAHTIQLAVCRSLPRIDDSSAYPSGFFHLSYLPFYGYLTPHHTGLL